MLCGGIAPGGRLGGIPLLGGMTPAGPAPGGPRTEGPALACGLLTNCINSA